MGWKTLVPLMGANRANFKVLEDILEKEDAKKVKKLLKENQISFSQSRIGTNLVYDEIFPILELSVMEKPVADFVELMNKQIDYHFKSKSFKEFVEGAKKTILSNIAPNITGLDIVKEAALLQLFSEQLHILLLGDPGIGKSDIMKSITDIAPISSFGLGSGTSSAGLAVTIKGNTIMPGLLPMAHEGIAIIDELNLMKSEDRASLYNAMEKGFITYDKGGNHNVFDAKINILAAANPIKDKFIGVKLEDLKKQIPFDSAMITRFHLVFLIKTPGVTQFSEIARRIVEQDKKKMNEKDLNFIKEYIDFAKQIKVDFPKEFQKEVVEFSRELKEKEKNFVVEVSPRMILGLVRLAKASARVELRNKVEKRDLDKAKEIIKTSLIVKKSI